MSDGNETFVESLKRSGAIKSSIIAMYINNVGFEYDGYGDPPSNLQIGSYDLSKYSTSSSFTVVAPVILPPDYWNIEISSVYIGNFQINSLTNVTIIDSGTSFLYIPSDNYYLLQNYLILDSGKDCDYDWIDGSIACICKSVNELMGFTAEVNGVNLTAPASSIWLYDTGYCYLLIGEGDSWLFGDVFLRNFYTAYDMDALTVSFAPAIRKSESKYLFIAGIICSLLF